MERTLIIVANPTVDGAVSAVLGARAVSGKCRMGFRTAEGLVNTFRSLQREGLPASGELHIYDLEVIHRNWDGESLRPRLMECLRGFARPVRWFSAEEWDPEDRAAVGHLVGEHDLVISENASCTAELVMDDLLPGAGTYEEKLVALAAGRDVEGEWAGRWREVISALKDDRQALAEALGSLVRGEPEALDENLRERARRTKEENRKWAEEHVSEPREMRGTRLVTLDVPEDRHPFWREVGDFALAKTGAEFCLLHLVGRPVLLLTKADGCRLDLRRWVRYLTDLLPPAQSLGHRQDVVPIVIDGLSEDPGLKEEALGLLRDGSHLLKSG